MYRFIGIEDLAANALIELLEKGDCRRVDFETLVKYGHAVISVLRENGDEATLLLSKEYRNELIRNYSDFFEIIHNEQKNDAIVLREGKTVEDLRNRFRAFLTLDCLRAFTNSKSLAELGVAV
ncbi:hypothetical protein [Desulfitobacterium sp. PCE1]|uniref:hypothetical protein n=1 Tax=Desulfitobacterium sp. PCE1 TaxID=146907 RepID=UPI0003A64193|nr:hypothetical protein [Desulfitobacterium sp. PCE1]